MEGRMRKIKALLLTAAFVISLTACSDPGTGSSSENSVLETETVEATTEVQETTEAETTVLVEEIEVPSEETVSSESSQANGELEVTYEGETKEIGEEKFGFIEVPEDWVEFHEMDSDGSVPMYQYSSMDTISVVTMSYVENMDAETVANSYYYSYSIDSVEGLSAATVELDGRTAYQVYAYFTDVNKIMVSWIFDGDDGLTHTLSIESQDYDIISLSGTYRLH